MAVLFCFVASAQYTPTGSKTRWINGVGLSSTRDTALFTSAADTNIVTTWNGNIYWKGTGYWNKIGHATNVGAQIHDSLYANYAIKAGTSAGGRFISNGGSVVAEWAAGGGTNFDFHGFAGYNANRSSSYTARSFTDKNYVDSSSSLKQNATFVNVKDFGALGDSTTNDYTAINNAIAYAVSSGQYWVHFPNGKYLVSGTITVPSFMRITGESIRRPIIFGNFSGTLLNLSGEGINVNNLLLDQSGALAGSTGRTGNAIDLIGTNSVNTSWTQITSVEAISNNKALNIDASTSSTQRGDIAITNCAFFHSGASDTGVVVKNTRYVAILNSSLFSTGSSTGCRLYSDANSPFLKVTSNAVTGQIDINGQSTSFSNVNFGGAVNLNAKNATVSGGSTSGNFTVNGDSSIVMVALIGTATITDNGAGNSIYSRYSKTIGVGKDATQAVDVLVSAGTNDGVLVTNSSTYNNWLGVNSSNVGFIGSTNGTPVQIQTNGTAAIGISTSQIITLSSLGTGTVQATSGVLSVTSDGRLKKKLGYFNNATDAIMKLAKPQYWKYSSKSKLPEEAQKVKQFGLMADDVHKVLGEQFAPTQKDGYYGLSDRALLGLAIQAIQELKTEIEQLKKK